MFTLDRQYIIDPSSDTTTNQMVVSLLAATLSPYGGPSVHIMASVNRWHHISFNVGAASVIFVQRAPPRNNLLLKPHIIHLCVRLIAPAVALLAALRITDKHHCVSY